MQQNSAEWRAARCGKLTASRLSDALAKNKSGWAASRSNLMSDLICERLTGVPTDGFVSAPMVHGLEFEQEARDAYAWRTDSEVTQVGFIDHPTINMSGASPDGTVGYVGLIEIKCPNTATHIETLLGGAVPSRYITQIQFQMACVGSAAWCDFVSFDPRLPDAMKLFIKRVPRDNVIIADLEKHVVAFLEELDAKLCALRSHYDLATVLKESA